MAIFSVNTDAAIAFTAKLEKLHRSAFPVAVRSTLNDAAFETKKLVPIQANRRFTIRQKSLFRNFTVVNKAKGFNIRSMAAVVGIDGNKSGGKKVAEGLEAQEFGSSIKGRKLIPHDKARVSGSYQKKLRAKYRFNKINIATRGRRKPGTKFVLIKKGNRGTVFDVSRGKLIPIYVHRRTRTTNLRASPFMRPAAFLATKKMDRFYKINAEKQFKRLLK